MKAKLIQIALGAVGSAIAAVIAHLTQALPDAGVAVVAAGPAANAILGNVVDRLLV